jgi:hypothetical protein
VTGVQTCALPIYLFALSIPCVLIGYVVWVSVESFRSDYETAHMMDDLRHLIKPE